MRGFKITILLLATAFCGLFMLVGLFEEKTGVNLALTVFFGALFGVLAWLSFRMIRGPTAQQLAELNVCTAERTRLQQELDELRGKHAVLSSETEKLRPFAAIIDIQSECERLKRHTQAEIEQAELINAALTSKTQEDAAQLIAQAKEQAQSIAAEAIEAKDRAKEYEQTAKAMRNIIEGYGDQYIIPTYTILDELADEFGYTQAGQALKDARNQTRQMIKAGQAAGCSYVEPERRQTAINFVLDAFNGKTDTILADVRHDNYGTLSQKIKDAYQIVNNNGKAFRDAHIKPNYLESRQNELKWATIAHELRQQELEEQRTIKAQIREEEKAMREYAKAMKDAQKEEETLKRLIEKAQSEVAAANEETRARHAEQLAALEVKLREAEEKNQRALSMAQQTRAGHVYITSNIGSFGEHVYKIGMTRRLEPLDRIRELGDASVPFEFDVHAMIYSDDAPKLEKSLHHEFLTSQINKVNPRKEFFRVNLSDIKTLLEAEGYTDVHWTLTAAAREYRESLAIEQQIQSDAQAKAEWEAAQIKAEQHVFEQEEIEA